MNVSIIAALFLTTSAAPAEPVVLSKTFDVCAIPGRGVSYQIEEGLDAASGIAKQGGAIVQIMIGRHPDLPPGIKNPFGAALLPLIALQGHVPEAGGRGMVSLYAYGVKTINMGHHTFQDQVLIMIRADKDPAALTLLNTVGSALVRCHSEK